MDDLPKIQHLFRLKEVGRAGVVNGRAESCAEHVYGCLILAEYFLKKVDLPLDENKVHKIILYHDLIEIETGDVFILDDKRKESYKDEEKGAPRLAQQIPKIISDDFLTHFKEYDEGTSREAKFAKAMSALEPMIHWTVYHPDWKKDGFTEQNLRDWKEKQMEPFPILKEFFEELIIYIKEKCHI